MVISFMEDNTMHDSTIIFQLIYMDTTKNVSRSWIFKSYTVDMVVS